MLVVTRIWPYGDGDDDGSLSNLACDDNGLFFESDT